MEEIKEKIRATLSQNSYWIVNKKTAIIFDNDTAILLSELIAKDGYYNTKDTEYDGWFQYSSKKIENTLNLTYHKQIACINKLKEFYIIDTRRKGTPAKQYFKINYEVYEEFLKINLDSFRGIKKQVVNEFKNLLLKNLKTTNITYSNISLNNNFNINNSVATFVATVSDEKIKPFKHFANKLGEIVTTKKNIKITTKKINDWANSIRLLHDVDKINIDRISNALNWYSVHHDDDYVPVIESGKSFREKFLRLEDAISREIKSVKRQRKTGYQNGRLEYKKPMQL